MTRIFQLMGKLSLLVLLLAVLFAFAMFEGGFVSWFLFTAVLSIGLYELGVFIYPIRGWRLSRHLSREVVQAGDEVQITLRIKRLLPFPIYFCLCEDILPDTLQQEDVLRERYNRLAEPKKRRRMRPVTNIVFPGFRRVLTLSYVLCHIPRGEHTLQTIRIRTGDVFGMVVKEHKFPVTNKLTGYPKQHPVQLSGSFNRHGQGAAPSKAINLKQTNEVAGIRAYVPGDSLSWIDWKQTARKGELITKEFAQEASTDTVVALDASQQAGKNPLAFEAALERTLGLLEAIQQQTSHIGLFVAGHQPAYFPLKLHQSMQPVLRYLTTLQPDDSISFSATLQDQIKALAPNANVFLVTTYLERDLLDVIKKMTQRARQVTVLLIQSASWLADSQQEVIHQLRVAGATVNVLTEGELARHKTEVTTDDR